MKPFYDIALKNLGSNPSYQLTAENFKDIAPEQVEGSFTSGNNNLQAKRFQAATSFVNNCQNISLSVNFKAQNLRSLFDRFVPENLKKAEVYPEGKTFPKVCKNAYTSKYYPLHTGWLMAVAMYNAGPIQAKLVGSYYQVQNNNFPAMNPLDLIEALHWGGKYKPGTDNIVFTDMDGVKAKGWFGTKEKEGPQISQRWFKSCIVQRHVARVIQHVTLPAESIAKSLDQSGCTLKGVPEYRQNSSGVKEKIVK